MLDFKPLLLEDVHRVKPYLMKRKNRLCDYTTGGIFLWRDYYATHFAVRDEVLFLRMTLNGVTAYTMPLGGDRVDILVEYVRQQGCDDVLRLCTVSEDDLQFLTSHYDVKSTSTSPDWYDYLYNADDLKYFKGRRYGGQRNHVNKFKKLYPDYIFEEICDANLDRVRLFYDKYCTAHPPVDATGTEEKKKIAEIFDNYKTYAMSGGAVFVGGEAVAFAIGETIGDTLNVNVEKADITVQGSYQMIVSGFAQHYAGENVKYINREDDMGNAGLKTSKLSYHPVCLLEKHIAELNL